MPEPGDASAGSAQAPQAWDRYAYVVNRPTRFIDPTGLWYYDPGCECLVHNRENINEHPENLLYRHKENEFDLSNSEVFIRRKENVAFGFRLEISGWAFAGYDWNLDILFFVESKELGIFVTPGGQVGIGGGQGATIGLLYGENLPERDAYAGPTMIEGGISIPLIIMPVNVETDVTTGFLPNFDSTIPLIHYYGIGPLQVEGGWYQEPAYTINIIGLVDKIWQILLRK